MMKPVYEFKNIQIEMTNACVHSCSNCTRFCGHHTKPFFMGWDTFQKAVDSLENWPRMVGIMGGEPTLHPEFKRFVDYAYEHHPSQFVVGGGEKPRKSLSKYIIDSNAIKSGPINKFKGLGLWSSVCDTYYNHYEQIQDKFIFQCVNDHTAVSRHGPWLITRKELAVPDDQWIELRDNCWWQRYLNSPSITPKGAFFCEVAAAMDMLFDGPGGWKIEKDWWQRGPEDFKEQLHWCEMCSGALVDFDRDANEDRDDVSPLMFEKLKEVNSPKLKKGAVVLHNLDAEDEIQLSPRKTMLLYQDDDELRVTSLNKSLYPKNIQGVICALGAESISDEMSAFARKNFKETTVFASKPLGTDFKEVVLKQGEEFIALGKVIRAQSAWVAVIDSSSGQIPFDFNEKDVVYNPGTLHLFQEEKMRLFHSACQSLEKAGFDGLKYVDSWAAFEEIWPKNKVFTTYEGFEENECPDFEDWVDTITRKGVIEFNFVDTHLHAMSLRRFILPTIKNALEGDLQEAFLTLDQICGEKLPSHLLCDEIKKAVLHLTARNIKHLDRMKEIYERTSSCTASYALAMVTDGQEQENHLIDCVIHEDNRCFLGLDYLSSMKELDSLGRSERKGILNQCLSVEGDSLVILGMRETGKSLELIFNDLNRKPTHFADDQEEHFRFDSVRALSVKNAVEKCKESTFLLSGYDGFGKKLKAQCDSFGFSSVLQCFDDDALMELDKSRTLEELGMTAEQLEKIKNIARDGKQYEQWASL